MYCKQCGRYMKENETVCPLCGTLQDTPPAQQTETAGEGEAYSYSQQAAPAPVYQSGKPEPEAESTVVSTVEWVWSILLSAVPLVNLVVLIIWGFGGGTAASKRNWARAQLILVAVGTVFSILMMVLLASLAWTTFQSTQHGMHF